MELPEHVIKHGRVRTPYPLIPDFDDVRSVAEIRVAPTEPIDLRLIRDRFEDDRQHGAQLRPRLERIAVIGQDAELMADAYKGVEQRPRIQAAELVRQEAFDAPALFAHQIARAIAALIYSLEIMREQIASPISALEHGINETMGMRDAGFLHRLIEAVAMEWNSERCLPGYDEDIGSLIAEFERGAFDDRITDDGILNRLDRGLRELEPALDHLLHFLAGFLC